MSMPRSPVFVTSEPAHNLIPAAGSALWYPARNAGPGISGLPTLAEVFLAPLASNPGGYGTSGWYTLPTDNGGASGGVGLRAIDDDEDRFLDAVMSFTDMTVGQEWLFACEAQYVEQTAVGTLWAYGIAATTSLWALQASTSEVPQFVSRAIGAGSQTTTSMTAAGGQTLDAFKSQGRFAAVLSVRCVSTYGVDVALHIGNAAVGSGIYTLSGEAIGGVGNAPPGANGADPATHGGLMIGARGGASNPSNFWGNGASNDAAIDNFQARRYSAYSATRAAEKLAKLIARPAEFVLED